MRRMEDEGTMVMGLKGYRGGSFIEEGKLVHVCEHLGRVHDVILIKCIFGSGKPRGVGIWARGAHGLMGEQRVSLRATGSRGGRILSQQGGFQVSG